MFHCWKWEIKRVVKTFSFFTVFLFSHHVILFILQNHYFLENEKCIFRIIDEINLYKKFKFLFWGLPDIKKKNEDLRVHKLIPVSHLIYNIKRIFKRRRDICCSESHQVRDNVAEMQKWLDRLVCNIGGTPSDRTAMENA